MNGDEDLGEDITMKGDKFHYLQSNTFLQTSNLKPMEPEKVNILEPRYGMSHSTFMTQTASSDAPEPIKGVRPFNNEGYENPEKVHTLDPRIAKTHTTFYDK